MCDQIKQIPEESFSRWICSICSLSEPIWRVEALQSNINLVDGGLSIQERRLQFPATSTN